MKKIELSKLLEILQHELADITEMGDLVMFESAIQNLIVNIRNERVDILHEGQKILISVEKLENEALEELKKTKASSESESEKQQRFVVKISVDLSRLIEKSVKLEGIIEKFGLLNKKITKETFEPFYPDFEIIFAKIHELQHQIDHKRPQLHKERIQRFHHFQADEQLAGERCAVCLDDVIVGRSMVRLDCEGRHVFCQHCIEGWFAGQNTCPTCRHVFA